MSPRHYPCRCWRYDRTALNNSEASVVADLERHLAPRSIVTDPDVVHGYAIDWSSRFHGSPACVVRAHTRDEVVTVMERSAALGFPVVAQGGNTGLVGATMAPRGSVILNLSGLTSIVEEDDASLVAEAGSTIASVQSAASRLGMVFGLDLASRDSASVGGAFNTNAGGIYASYWGRMRDQVIGVEAVMADGTVVSSIEGDAEAGWGVDPVDVLAGSEGTLAVVTALRLRLRAPVTETTVVLAGFDSVEAAARLVAGLPGVMAGELLGEIEMATVVERGGLARPMAPRPWYLLIEVESGSVDVLELDDDAVVGSSLWSYRQGISESIEGLGIPHKFDVVVPPERLEDLHAGLMQRLAPNRVFMFGHLLRSNAHFNVVPPHPEATVPEEVDRLVLDAVEEAGGSAAGEQGVGRAKAEWVRASLPPGRRDLIDALKRALDPDGRLNPGAGAARP